jgi:hypothetical protein
MSEKNTAPEVRAEEPELNDEALEQVAGGCAINSQIIDPHFTIGPSIPIGPIHPTFPTIETIAL